MTAVSANASVQSIRSDIVVIGAGIGGYTAAIRLGQLGKNVVLVEKDKIGGVCLNVGCIPSKALITASKLAKNARNAGKMGIDATIKVDIKRLQEWKQNAVNRLTGGVSLLCKANKVQVVSGSARLVNPNLVEVSSDAVTAPRSIECNSVIIATGSSSIELPNLKFDGQRIITS
ncbi:MAG: FAD-dependent oxidoreductase, partial [Thaumarchaeota archaeon]|nr:FAD-dependent oxidoreductase [Nitrososphaerota archaeon]